MTVALAETFEPGSDEWREQRRKMLGGSEIAAVVGLSPFESPFSLWHRKAGLADPQSDQPVMEWGRRLEDAIRRKWLERESHGLFGTGETFVRDGWMIASPDARVATGEDFDRIEILEVKTSPRGDEWAREDTDPEKAIPVYYQCQAQWYMAVLGLSVCHFAVLISGYDYREYTLPRNDDEIKYLTECGRAFLDSIAQGRRPNIDAHTQTYETIKELHPDIDGEDVQIDADLAEQWISAVKLLDVATAEHGLAKNLLADAMGSAKRAFCGTQKLADRRTKNGGIPYLQQANGLAKIERGILAA